MVTLLLCAGQDIELLRSEAQRLFPAAAHNVLVLGWNTEDRVSDDGTVFWTSAKKFRPDFSQEYILVVTPAGSSRRTRVDRMYARILARFIRTKPTRPKFTIIGRRVDGIWEKISGYP